MPRILLPCLFSLLLVLLPILIQPPALVLASEFGKPAAMQQAVESQLLALLGMSKRPRPRGSRPVSHADIPPYMLELYHRINLQHQRYPDDSEQEYEDAEHGSGTWPYIDVNLPGSSNTVRSFVHKDEDKDKLWSWEPHQTHVRFDIGSIPSGEKLQAAELRVYLNLNSSSSGRRNSSRMHRVHILVHEVVRAASSNREPILRLVDSRKVKTDQWESLDVIPAVKRWIGDPKANRGLVVEVATEKGEPHPHATSIRVRRSLKDKEHTPQHKNHQQWQDPLLVAYSDDGKTRRRHRAAERGHRIKGHQQNCQRKMLYVDFSDVGWQDWIVAPPGYHAYMCNGDCPYSLPEHLNTTNHAVVQNLVNSMHPASVPKACCVPTELSAISMLYTDEVDKVVLKNYNEMVVEACGCR